MVTDDILLDDLERSQLDAIRRRRANRSRRYWQLLAVVGGMLLLGVLALPSLVSQTGIARSMLASRAQQAGWQATADSVDVGWLTPLTVQNLELVGPSGETTLNIGRANTALTVTELIRFDPAQLGAITLRDLDLACTVAHGNSSLESDLAVWLSEDEADTESDWRGTLEILDGAATVTDAVSGQSWTLKQSKLDARITPTGWTADIAGVVIEPGGGGGSIQSHFVWHRHPADVSLAAETREAAGASGQAAAQWELALETDSFPLSVTDLISRRWGDDLGGSLPHQFSGDTSGKITLRGRGDAGLEADLGEVRIRNLRAVKLVAPETSPQTDLPESDLPQAWNNQLATLDGRLVFSGRWLRGENLEVTTDFASAAVDGSFPTQISLVGINDNPLRWLQTFDGQAQVEVDLAALDQALPGLLPVRSNAVLVSGRARGMLENRSGQSEPGSGAAPRSSQLILSSDSLRARADGRLVVIEPIEVTATVTEQEGTLRADRFKFSSSFANASGSGTLAAGTAQVRVDFGRLYTMLRPVIDLSDLSLGGTAGGDVQWSVKAGRDGADRWELGGSGEARNLLVTLPGGDRFKRDIVQGDLSATGRWEGQRLRQLGSAEVSLRSSGVSAEAELLSAVDAPTADSVYPVRVQLDGRLENLNESLRTWLPEMLRSAEGRLTGSAIARIARSSGSLSKADFVLRRPRIHYGDYWFTQPELEVHFQGNLDWPSGNFVTQETTLVGESLSLALRGDASRERTDLDIAWQADLAGLHKSFGSTIARAAALTPARPISFRPGQATSHSLSGRTQGKLKLRDAGEWWELDAEATVNQLSLYAAKAATSLNPPVTFGQSFGRAQANTTGELLWREPRVKLNGQLRYDPSTASLQAPGLQVATDWLASTLSGQAQWGDERFAGELSGPTRWKADLVGQHLAQALGLPIDARGLHDGQCEVRWEIAPDQPATWSAKTDLGWQQCEIAGVRLGRATLPLEFNQQRLKVDNTTIPVVALAASGQPERERHASAELAAELDYRAAPMTLRLAPGSKVQGLRITPAAAASWLKYLAPLAADATRIDGTLDAEFDQADLVLNRPAASTVRGRIDVHRMALSSGPLASQLISGVEQIKSLAKLTGGVAEPPAAKTLIEMPPQTVEFSFENGVATHHRMFFEIDRANLITSGQVQTDTQINLVAQVPLDARWLGSDLQGLAGQTLSFPIRGTLRRPRLDDSAIRQVMSELGSKASAEVIRSRLDGLIQKELGSSMEQLNSGLEKILGF